MTSQRRGRLVLSVESPPYHDVALDRAGITVLRDITFLEAGPASERCRSAAWFLVCRLPFGSLV